MISKKIEDAILELIELGYSERKIMNRLKEIKKELIGEEIDFDYNNDKKFNKYINGLLFGGAFYIESPSQPLLGLIKNIKKMYGSEYCYYLLYQILTEQYFNNQTHDKSDNDKSNWLMYLIKEKNDKYLHEFSHINKSCKEPI